MLLYILIILFLLTILSYFIYLIYSKKYFKTLELYSNVETKYKSNEIIGKILEKENNDSIEVIKSPKDKNYYDDSKKMIILTEKNYSANNIKANFIALHELSHAYQWNEKESIAKIFKFFRWPLIILGTLANFYLFLYIFLFFFSSITFIYTSLIFLISFIVILSIYFLFIVYAINQYFFEKDANKKIFKFVNENFEYTEKEKEKLKDISKKNNIFNFLKTLLPLMIFFQTIFIFVWIIFSFIFNLVKVLLPKRKKY